MSKPELPLADGSQPDASRRRFLASVGGVAAGAVLVPACGAPSTGGNDAAVVTDASFSLNRTTVAQFPIGASLKDTTKRVLVFRDALGFFAVSYICTHQMCAVGLATDGTTNLACSCHSSTFDRTGNVLRPPDDGTQINPLPFFRVVFTGTGDTATFDVDTSSPVTDRTQRYFPS